MKENKNKVPAKRYLVGITAKSAEDMGELEKYGLDLKKRTARKKDDDSGFSISGILTDEQIQQLKSLRYIVEVHRDLSKEAKERLEEVSRFNRFADTNEINEIKKKIALPKYMNTDEIETVLVKLHKLYPDIIDLIELPNPTCEARLSKAIMVHAGSANSKLDRIGVLFTGSMHAREWGGSDICINFLTNLLSSYKYNTSLTYGKNTFSSEQIRTMLENIGLFVFPDVNPDGKAYSQAHDDTTPLSLNEQDKMWWRKNRNPVIVPNGDDPIHHGTGVDINRNFDFLWGSGIGTLSDDHNGRVHSLNYPGVKAFSESEARNIQHLFDIYDNILYFVDIHSCGEMILYSWGDDTDQNDDRSENFLNDQYAKVRGKTRGRYADDYKEFIEKADEDAIKGLANRMNEALKKVRGRSYKVQQSAGLYTTSGTSDDYAFSRHIANKSNSKIYGFTIEFANDKMGFIPPISEMQNIIEEVSSAMTEFCIASYENERLSSSQPFLSATLETKLE